MSAAPGPAGPAPEGRLRLVLAYDGAPFSGFARQRDRHTVQGELEAALSRLARRPVQTVGAGRTDAGVHARGQVVHADVPARLDPERVRRALNGALGPAIVVREADWAPPGFDARLSARRRTYVYRVDDSGSPDPLLRGFVLAWPRPLSVPRMREAARPLDGEHDFASFCRSRSTGRASSAPSFARGNSAPSTDTAASTRRASPAGPWSISNWMPARSAIRPMIPPKTSISRTRLCSN